MIKNIFIGADGGGTKTKIIVEDQDGNLLGQSRSGPANIRTSVEQAWESINAGVQEALNQAGLDLTDKNYCFHIGLALAGTEDLIASEKFLSRQHRFTTLVLDSDAYAACLGVHDCQDGAIIIIGTGVIGYELYQNQRYIVGGWGFPQADVGGGAWLGLEAVRLVFKKIDERIEDTPLLKAIFNYFDNDVSRLVSWCTNAKPVNFAKLAPIVIEYIKLNDPYALALIAEAATEVDDIAITLEKRLPKQAPPLPYCLMSGLAPFIQPLVSETLKSRLVERKHDAPKGAVYMIRKKVLGTL